MLSREQDYGTKNTYEERSINIERKDNEKIADHLIANGVPVQKWIPVTERLPKGGNGEDLSENVIAYLNNGEIAEVCTGWCNGDQWWLIYGDRDTHTAWGLGAVTHWMPLPDPPEGE